MPTSTSKGHLYQERKNLQSTQAIAPFVPISALAYPDAGLKTMNAMVSLFPVNRFQKAFSDLTGRFPHKPSRGHEYVFVLYHYDSNDIFAEPVKNRQAETLTQALEKINSLLKSRGEQPLLYILDNEISQDLRKAFSKNKVAFQLVPPHMHRKNAAERAISMFKNHFLAGLASCDPSFPLVEWDRLIYQAVLTLNLLRPSRLNPQLSSYAYLFGNFDFNRCPLAPPGTKIVAHDRPENRPSWVFLRLRRLICRTSG